MRKTPDLISKGCAARSPEGLFSGSGPNQWPEENSYIMFFKLCVEESQRFPKDAIGHCLGRMVREKVSQEGLSSLAMNQQIRITWRQDPVVVG